MNDHLIWPTRPPVGSGRTARAPTEQSGLTGGTLKLAIYWSGINLWTLLDLDKSAPRDGVFKIALGDAMMANETYKLGDLHIGTTPPLVMRFVADPTKRRVLEPVAGERDRSHIRFTVGKVELMCDGVVMTDRDEQNLAYYLMLFSGWDTEKSVDIEDGLLEAVVLTAVPEEWPLEQGFAICGAASSLLTAQLMWGFVDNKPQELRPYARPSTLIKVLRADRQKNKLPIWKLELRPTSTQ